MPSVSMKQHKFFLYKLHAKDSTEEERRVAKEFLDADRKAGLWQTDEHVNTELEINDILYKIKAIDWE